LPRETTRNRPLATFPAFDGAAIDREEIIANVQQSQFNCKPSIYLEDAPL